MTKDSTRPTLPETGFIRLSQVLQFIPVSKTSWYEGVKSGVYPAPVKLSTRTAAYRCEDILALIESMNHLAR